MANISSCVFVALISAAAASPPTLGALKQSLITAPGGFSQSCAGPATCGCGGAPGDDWTGVYTGTLADKHELAFSGNSSASLAASYSSGNVSNNSSCAVGMGYATMAAHDSFPATAAFSLGSTNGGWKETFLITNAAHTGQAGVMQFIVNVAGRLDATGITGLAAIETEAYKNNAAVLPSHKWSVATSGGPPFTVGLDVSEAVNFTVPFTFGTSFTLGVYVDCRAGQRSSGANPTISTSTVMLSQFSWGGISGILFNGAPITGSSISSGTGIDWNQPVQPDICPADINNDGVVDDTDFSLFVVAYNILDCADPAMPAGCPSDINSDGAVDDADFTIFVVAYNELLCP
ncbi:MAG: hypothetical protein ACREJD_16565 [Phycisphaerales bacterium]